MTEHTSLHSQLQDRLVPLRERQQIGNALFHAARLALVGSGAALLVALFAALFGEARSAAVLAACAGLALGLPLVGFALGYLWPVEDLRIARSLDRSAASEDRFASALQLCGHRRTERAALVVADALSAVEKTSAQAAIPFRAPRELKWLPLPIVALALLIFLAPARLRPAQAAEEPEVSAAEWAELHAELERQLAALPEPKTPEEKELAEELQRLSEMLKGNPEKKAALAEIARLQNMLEQKKLDQNGVSMRAAAQAMQASATLAQFSQMLSRGDYEGAAGELDQLAQALEDDKAKMDAEEFENVAKDLDELAKQTEKNGELSQSCKNAASAAGRMNRQELCDAMRKLSNTMKKNCDSMRKCDSACRSRSLLDDLMRKLSKCKNGKCKSGHCKSGNCDGEGCSGGSFTKWNDKKGGRKAGWGTARNWRGGSLSGDSSQNESSMEDPVESSGELSATPTVSPDERAVSTQEFKDTYAEMVRKAEADLELESVPPAMREYLKRYFVSLRPVETDEADANEAAPKQENNR